MKATPCIAEASTTEEPVAEKLHGGVCAGGPPVRAVPTAEIPMEPLLSTSWLAFFGGVLTTLVGGLIASIV